MKSGIFVKLIKKSPDEISSIWAFSQFEFFAQILSVPALSIILGPPQIFPVDSYR